MVSCCVTYKCHSTQDNNPNLTFFSLPRNGKNAKIWENRINHTDLPKIIALCEEYFQEPCFSKSVDLRRRLMNSKDEFMFNFDFLFSMKLSAIYFTANGA